MHHAVRILLPILFAIVASGCVTDDDDPLDELGSTTAALTTVFETAPDALTCTPPYLVAAAPGEEGQWAAVRVGRTTGRPFRPERVRFVLRGSSPAAGTWCAGNAGPFRVRIFYGPDPTPAAQPTQVVSRTIAAGSGTAEQTRTVDVGVRSLPIPADQWIFVAVEMVGDPATDTGYNCLAGCGPRTRGSNWWSLATGAPYGWVELSTLGGFDFDIGMRVEGAYL